MTPDERRAVRRFERALRPTAKRVTHARRFNLRAAVYRHLAQHSDGLGYRALAQAAYGISEPTAAQQAAVRRAVGWLVRLGFAERDHNPDSTVSVKGTG